MRHILGAFAIFVPVMVCAQTAAPPAFEVAEVKVNKSGSDDSSGQILASGQLSFRHVSMKELVEFAWRLEDYNLAGGPSWLDSDYFDVIAKAEPRTPEATVQLMLQTLLKERFKLAVHTESKTMQVCLMTAAKSGAKLKLSPEASSFNSTCKMGRTAGVLSRVCVFNTMEELASNLPQWASGYIKIPVLDATGLKGRYDFTLEWTGRGVLSGVNANGEAPADGAGGGNGMTIFEAMEKQLGLKLDTAKKPIPVTVIDHVERVPTEN
jgi:uncharacterized protein (TIGR03435 family)